MLAHQKNSYFAGKNIFSGNILVERFASTVLQVRHILNLGGVFHPIFLTRGHRRLIITHLETLMISRSFEFCIGLVYIVAMGCGSVEMTIFPLPGAEGEVAALVVDVESRSLSGECNDMELEIRASGVFLEPGGIERTCVDLPVDCQHTLLASQGVFPQGSQVMVVLREYTCSGKVLDDVAWFHPGDAVDAAADAMGPDATESDASAPDAGTADANVSDAQSDAS